MISLEQALEQIGKSVIRLEDEVVSISEAGGRVLAEQIAAAEDLPSFNRSSMDGYAVRSEDVKSATKEAPVKLKLTGTVPAGTVPSVPVTAGTTVRVYTGSMLPEGADAVVVQEDTEISGESVGVPVSIKRGANWDPSGSDVKEGQTVLEPGVLLHARQVALLAALGYAEVRVAKRPRVAILATGSELVEVDEQPGTGKVRNSNSYALHRRVAEAGAEPQLLGIADDDKEDLSDKIDLARDYDMLLLSAGVSVSERDLVKDVLKAMGFETTFWQVAVKPGRPILFGKLGKLVVFGLPGNPVSAQVTFDLFVRPALARMQGRADGGLRTIWAELAEPFTHAAGRRTFVRAALSTADGRNVVRATGPQGSGILRSLSDADCLAILPEDQPELAAGAKVRVALLDGS